MVLTRSDKMPCSRAISGPRRNPVIDKLPTRPDRPPFWQRPRSHGVGTPLQRASCLEQESPAFPAARICDEPRALREASSVAKRLIDDCGPLVVISGQ